MWNSRQMLKNPINPEAQKCKLCHGKGFVDGYRSTLVCHMCIMSVFFRAKHIFKIFDCLFKWGNYEVLGLLGYLHSSSVCYSLLCNWAS